MPLQYRIIDGFLTDQECDELVQQASVQGRFVPSTGLDPYTGKEISGSDYRICDTAFFALRQNELIARIETRILDRLATEWFMHTGLEAAIGNNGVVTEEGLQVLRYKPGGLFKEHSDYFDPSQGIGYKRQIDQQGQRVATIILYLNTVPEHEGGGATYFTRAGVRVQPVKGRALMFWNVELFGLWEKPGSNAPIISDMINPMSIHTGELLNAGVKIIATKWIRIKK